MRLTSLHIQNYKSLRGIRFKPTDLSVIVGANASGKSNFADAIDFLSEVYRHGLEVAVARKGGFENIAFRRMRRSKGAIVFQSVIEVSSKEIRRYWPRRGIEAAVQYTHEFALGVRTSSIRAEYEVLREQLLMAEKVDDGWIPLVSLNRDREGSISLKEFTQRAARDDEPARDSKTWAPWLDFSELRNLSTKKRTLPSSELFVTSIGRYTLGLHSFLAATSGIRVFQISPTRSREFGVPIPRAELEVTGGNLPAVVDLIKRQSKPEWARIMDTMRTILPSLRDIVVDYTSSRTLGLYFDEEGVGRPWSVGEVSDGTIQTLALLVALHDDRYSALVLEEPENSVHPWIIRHLLTAAKEAAKEKQIVITTHSPIVMNSVSPENVHVMWRHQGESHLAGATTLRDGFLQAWQSGSVATFDVIDSGAVPQAIPPGPNE